MSDSTLDALRLVTVPLFILGNAFFVVAEFGLVSVRRTRIEELVSEGHRTARVDKHVLSNPDRLIATTQLGITMMSLGLGALGQPALQNLLEPVFGFLPATLVPIITPVVAAGTIAFVLMTCLDVVVGELMPKSVTLNYPVQAALLVARP